MEDSFWVREHEEWPYAYCTSCRQQVVSSRVGRCCHCGLELFPSYGVALSFGPVGTQEWSAHILRSFCRALDAGTTLAWCVEYGAESLQLAWDACESSGPMMELIAEIAGDDALRRVWFAVDDNWSEPVNDRVRSWHRSAVRRIREIYPRMDAGDALAAAHKTRG